jgi:hypothetical protein
MDRRHGVLAVAVAASVATSYAPPPPLFYGEQSLDADPVWLDETRPVRTWVITTDARLPAEATERDFTSTTEVDVRVSDGDSGARDGRLVVVLSECGSGSVSDGPGGLAVEDAFEDCLPRQTCRRTFCVAIGNDSDHALEVEWSTRTIIESHAWVDYDVDPILVPIEITIEETEP